MNKRALLLIGIIFTICIVLILILIFIINYRNTNSISLLTEKSSKELILDIKNSDLLKGFIVIDQRPRIESDIAGLAKDNGWKEGYFISVAMDSTASTSDRMYIDQSISKYPLNNIGDVFKKSIADKVDGCIYNSLPIEDLNADQVNANLVKCDSSSTYGKTEVYEIQFIKKDVFMYFGMSGNRKDFELLQNICREVISKI